MHFKLTSDPTRLFLIDCIGAFITSLLTFTLSKLEPYIGMPEKILWWLAAIALLFSIYSFLCYQLKLAKVKSYLRVIMFANAIYCATTISLLLYFYEKVTGWGFAYFISEIIIVSILVHVEYKSSLCY